MNKDISVESSRVIACLMVIGIHITLSICHDDYVDVSRLAFACVVADAVGIFWLILGFFLFKNNSYAKLLKKTAVSIGIPTLLFSGFAFFFGEWIAEGVTLKESIFHTAGECLDVVKELLKWNSPVKYGGHLWYIYVYALIIFIFPVLKATVQYLEEDEQREKVFMIATLGAFIVNDITRNQLFEFSHHSINALIPASIIVIWGHILYKHRDTLTTRKHFVLSVLVFGILNSVRILLQFYAVRIGAGDHILFWYSSIGLLFAVCVAVFTFCLKKWLMSNTWLKSGILFLAGHTFNIYLFHFFVIYILGRLSFQTTFYDRVRSDVLFMILLTVTVFMVSLIISVGVRKIGRIFSKK